MSVWYWIAVVLMMAAAFTTAWGFIVKGCEAMDESHPPQPPEDSAE